MTRLSEDLNPPTPWSTPRGMKAIGPGTLIAPLPPALVSVGDAQHANLITLAWTGIINTKPPRCTLSIRPERYSHDFLLRTGFCVLHLVDEPMVERVDRCGVESGRTINKFDYWAGSVETIGPLYPPVITSAPLALLIKIIDHQQQGSHTQFTGEILTTFARADLMEGQRLRLDLTPLVAYSHGLYQRLGEVLGFFGYSVSEQGKRQRRLALYRQSPPQVTKGKKGRRAVTHQTKPRRVGLPIKKSARRPQSSPSKAQVQSVQVRSVRKRP